ncbi:hypothetical protein Ataiwa_11150 [Algoriphagus taiwanensis]|uniref:Uncharacterized protein n=1 Tax=Algoriphagus taiwanensis TaxID=1445656 RepID=A0ABQ6Q079_9BACT|nr:hypothetical protein Ataiwa_11150 [Algoriphagus taiwanensis]
MIWVYAVQKWTFQIAKTKSKPGFFQFQPGYSRLCLSEIEIPEAINLYLWHYERTRTDQHITH